MEENEGVGLDVEFKRYLQIMRPYLEQLLDQDIIEICKSWIQRLSNCSDNEKHLRNKYVFSLCYQLAKGVLDEPFLSNPPIKELMPLSDDLVSSDISSTEIEYIVINSEEDTRVLFNSKKTPTSDTDYHSQDNDHEIEGNHNEASTSRKKQSQFNRETFYCYTWPEALKGYQVQKQPCDEYKVRANNLVMKLRELKAQNQLLHKELEILKQECKIKSCENFDESIIKVDHCTSVCCHSKDSSVTLNSLKTKLQEVQDSRNSLIQTIDRLQEKIDNYDDMKKHEIEEIEASHKLEIIKVKTATREESKEIYEKKIEEVKAHYEMMIENIRTKLNSEKYELVSAKDRVIAEKEKIIEEKDNEIIRLRNLNDDQKGHLHEVINKFLEKPNDDSPCDGMRLKAEQLEKRLNKIEKSKTKSAKVYEAKLAYMQREKHLAECSLQLQLARQRAQVVSDVADENQVELTAALNKLENKYKEIVGNMQATAIQRRVQDQMAIESILHAACGIRNEGYTNCSPSPGTNRSQFSGKTMQNQNRNGNQINQSYDSEISALLNDNKVDNLIGGNKSLGEDSVMAGYCLDGERMGELFERVYIPQRDIGDGPLKK